MKMANSNLTYEQAASQLKQFSVVGLFCSVLGLVLFWWLGIIGAAFGARSLILVNHKANKNSDGAKKYTIIAVAGLLVGITDVVLVNIGK